MAVNLKKEEGDTDMTKVMIAPNGQHMETLRRCGGYYKCPKGPDGTRMGPLVGYAGKYGGARGLHKVVAEVRHHYLRDPGCKWYSGLSSRRWRYDRASPLESEVRFDLKTPRFL